MIRILWEHGSRVDCGLATDCEWQNRRLKLRSKTSSSPCRYGRVAISVAPHALHRNALPCSHEFIISRFCFVASLLKTSSVEPHPNAKRLPIDFRSSTSPDSISSLHAGQFMNIPDRRTWVFTESRRWTIHSNAPESATSVEHLVIRHFAVVWKLIFVRPQTVNIFSTCKHLVFQLTDFVVKNPRNRCYMEIAGFSDLNHSNSCVRL